MFLRLSRSILYQSSPVCRVDFYLLVVMGMGKLELALNCAIREQGQFHPDGKDGTCKAETFLTKYHGSLHIG